MSGSDDTLWRLIELTHQTNLVALDTTLSAVRLNSRPGYFAAAASRCASIGERMCRASQEVHLTLELKYRRVKTIEITNPTPLVEFEVVGEVLREGFLSHISNFIRSES